MAAYWFDDGAFTRRVVRVPAAQVIHGFEALRPGQLHGISPFVACVMVAGDLAELLDSELDATRLQSKYLGFVQSHDPVGFQADRRPQAAGPGLSNATLNTSGPGIPSRWRR
ncbi:MAG: phage portal protein [Bilophila wadsworthia]